MEPVRRALGGAVAHDLTRGPGDEARLATEAVGRGFRRIVAVGGDGTWSNVAGALIGSGSDAALGLVPGGTGCDLARSLGVPADPVAAARLVREGSTRRIDVGRIEDRHFLNVAGFGFDIAVIEDSWTAPRLPGGLVYLYCALRQLFRFPGFHVEMSRDGERAAGREMLMLVIANGRVFGGGFRIAPDADLADGQLEAVAFANMRPRRRLPLLLRLLRGSHRDAPEVESTRGARFTLRFAAPPAYETDGEWNRARGPEIEVRCVPSALRVLAPPADGETA